MFLHTTTASVANVIFSWVPHKEGFPDRKIPQLHTIPILCCTRRQNLLHLLICYICDLIFSEHFFCISGLGWLFTVPLRLLPPYVFERQLLLACLREIYSNSGFVFSGFIDKVDFFLSIFLPETFFSKYGFLHLLARIVYSYRLAYLFLIGAVYLLSLDSIYTTHSDLTVSATPFRPF